MSPWVGGSLICCKLRRSAKRDASGADRDQRAGLFIPAGLAGCRHGVAACALGDHARGTAPVRKEAIFERLKALWDAAGAALGLVSAARLIACGFLGGFAMLSPHPGGQHFIF